MRKARGSSSARRTGSRTLVHANTMLCYAHTHRAVRGHARRAAGTCHMAFVPRRLSGSLARGGRGRGGRRRRASWVSRSRADRGAAVLCVCVFRAWPLCVLATGVAADEFAGRGVVGSVSAAEPPRITDVSRLLSPLDSHDTANEVYVHIYPWSYGNKRQRQQSTARRPFSHLSLSL